MKNVDNALQDALQALYPNRVYPNRYTGGELEYVVTNYTTIPAVFADRNAHAARHLVQVHYYCPDKQNPNPAKLAISAALTGEGFTQPTVTPAHDNEGQHWIFECEYANGGAHYGQS